MPVCLGGSESASYLIQLQEDRRRVPVPSSLQSAVRIGCLVVELMPPFVLELGLVSLRSLAQGA